MSGDLIRNDIKYMRKIEKEHRMYYDSLPPVLKRSLTYYTGAGYKNINNYMRGKPITTSEGSRSYESTIEEIKQHIENINEILINSPPLEKALEVYRGVSMGEEMNYNKGDVVDLFRDSFTSTSFNLDVSVEYAGDVCCLFVLYLTPGTRGLYIGTSSSISTEYEYILAPGTTFKIIGKGKETVPIYGISGKKTRLLTYRAICQNCDTYMYQGPQIKEIHGKIDEQYLVGLSKSTISKLNDLSWDCEHRNYITNPKTGRCVKIDGRVAKDIIGYLEGGQSPP